MAANDFDLTKRETKKDVVPWYGPEQFCKVYECLYSTELTKKRWAVDQISVWDTRCHPNLPAPIEASLVLCRAVIQDILYENGTSLCQEKDIQMLYAMALVSFVNLTIEPNQTYEKQPNVAVSQCLDIPIPSWIVDLRNEASHSFYPPLPVLRMGANAAINYLNDSYWSVEATLVRNIVKEPMDLDPIKKLINNYQVCQYNLQHLKNTETGEYLKNTKEIKTILKSISTCISRNRNAFIEALMIDGYFILSENDLQIMLTKNELCKFYHPKNTKAKVDSECSDEEDEEEIKDKETYSMPQLPRVIEMFWLPLLRVINNRGIMPYFLESLLYTQSKRDKTGQRLLASWVLRILRLAVDMNPVKGFTKSELRLMFENKCPVFNWERLFFAAIAEPCKYTPYFFPVITSNLDIEKEILRSFMNLVAISQGQAVDSNYKLPKSCTAFTLEKLKQDKKKQELKKKMIKKESKDTNIWSYASDSIDFSTIPIGAVFKSPPEDDEEMMEEICTIDFNLDFKYTERFIWGNENDEDVKNFITIEQNITLGKDKQLINAQKDKDFVYKKK